MNKKEILWREILFQAIEKQKTEFTQKDLAEKFGFSTSTVFNALKIPRQSGAVKVTGRNFSVIDIEKFLYLWATQRNVGNDIIYKTSFPGSVREIEGMMPCGAIFAAYSAYGKKYRDAPADYDKVYVCAGEKALEEIKKRFPKTEGYENVIILRPDQYLEKFGTITPDAQTFVDLWNLSDWYAKDFLNSLKNKMFN